MVWGGHPKFIYKVYDKKIENYKKTKVVQICLKSRYHIEDTVEIKCNNIFPKSQWNKRHLVINNNISDPSKKSILHEKKKNKKKKNKTLSKTIFQEKNFVKEIYGET